VSDFDQINFVNPNAISDAEMADTNQVADGRTFRPPVELRRIIAASPGDYFLIADFGSRISNS
jgi:hypothetical protein